MKMNFSLTQIEYVLSVVKHGHFSLAAKACFVTQPTLSMQIQKLENDLGTVLFDRTRKPILLTKKGEELVEQMRVVYREASRLGEILSETDEEVSGELTVGIIPTVAPYLLPRLLPVVAEQFPGLQLKIFELQTHRIAQMLEDDQIEVGLLAMPLEQSKIHERALYSETFSVLCQIDHPLARLTRVTQNSLKPDDIWLLEEGHCLRQQVLDVCGMRKARVKGRQFQFESGSLETLKNLVSAYGGYTLLPSLATKVLPPGTKLIPFEKPAPAREIGLVTGRLHYKKGLQDALAESVRLLFVSQLR
jgi:LysR family hydrogen peroxide-inducible transcriptional activator